MDIDRPYIRGLVKLVCEGGYNVLVLRNMYDISMKKTDMVASHIGMSIAGYKKIEHGSNGARVDTLLMLAKLYGVSLD